jgi:hypothetical protein
MGDSRVIIDWLNDRGQLQASTIEGWKIRTKDLIKKFQAISFHHIYREFNKEADQLSKQALLEYEGKITYYLLGTWRGRSFEASGYVLNYILFFKIVFTLVFCLRLNNTFLCMCTFDGSAF